MPEPRIVEGTIFKGLMEELNRVRTLPQRAS